MAAGDESASHNVVDDMQSIGEFGDEYAIYLSDIDNPTPKVNRFKTGLVFDILHAVGSCQDCADTLLKLSELHSPIHTSTQKVFARKYFH